MSSLCHVCLFRLESLYYLSFLSLLNARGKGRWKSTNDTVKISFYAGAKLEAKGEFYIFGDNKPYCRF